MDFTKSFAAHLLEIVDAIQATHLVLILNGPRMLRSPAENIDFNIPSYFLAYTLKNLHQELFSGLPVSIIDPFINEWRMDLSSPATLKQIHIWYEVRDTLNGSSTHGGVHYTDSIYRRIHGMVDEHIQKLTPPTTLPPKSNTHTPIQPSTTPQMQMSQCNALPAIVDPSAEFKYHKCNDPRCQRCKDTLIITPELRDHLMQFTLPHPDRDINSTIITRNCMTRADLADFAPGVWVNNSGIDGHNQLVMERSLQDSLLPNIYIAPLDFTYRLLRDLTKRPRRLQGCNKSLIWFNLDK